MTRSSALAGRRVGITADRRWRAQADLLENLGAEVIHGPTLRTVDLSRDDRLRRATFEPDPPAARLSRRQHRHRHEHVAGRRRVVGARGAATGGSVRGHRRGPGGQGEFGVAAAGLRGGLGGAVGDDGGSHRLPCGAGSRLGPRRPAAVRPGRASDDGGAGGPLRRPRPGARLSVAAPGGSCPGAAAHRGDLRRDGRRSHVHQPAGGAPPVPPRRGTRAGRPAAQCLQHQRWWRSASGRSAPMPPPPRDSPVRPGPTLPGWRP